MGMSNSPSPVESQPYKLKPIRILMRFDEPVYVPIFHPFRRHREFVIAHCRSQQRQHVRMVKGFPCHNFLTEPLHRPRSAHQPTPLQNEFAAYAFDLVKVTRRVYPQNFDGDAATLVLTLPHVAIPTAIQRGVRLLIAKWNLQRARK